MYNVTTRMTSSCFLFARQVTRYNIDVVVYINVLILGARIYYYYLLLLLVVRMSTLDTNVDGSILSINMFSP